ncbi:uncharacterized protein A4U43_C03F27660 [Asparagus officinalis]|uniref:Uncharacterized protein n=1 Tax=Asparagus officinalis TaxID=4686 RepID=A0A5P1FFC2_ASPOF|nr:uncharacterized protein A4U43_C03F27660 [Asparagus officinalis]
MAQDKVKQVVGDKGKANEIDRQETELLKLSRGRGFKASWVHPLAPICTPRECAKDSSIQRYLCDVQCMGDEQRSNVMGMSLRCTGRRGLKGA